MSRPAILAVDDDAPVLARALEARVDLGAIRPAGR